MDNLSNAFEVTSEDVLNVLEANAVNVANTEGKPFDVMAEEIFAGFTGSETDRIARAALDSGVDLDAQTSGAYDEIRGILIEEGILKK